MKKITFTIAAILGFSSLALAQDLYVSPTSYMYVQDEVVFVNDDIRLEAADSNIYLRDGAQLVQNSNEKNSDAGELSVYQEQTGGIYEYSYWGSPVGVSAEGTTKENVKFDVTNFRDPASALINEVNSSPYSVSPYGYDSTPTQIKTYWIWKTVNAFSYAQWDHVTNTGDVDPGWGFTMKGTPGSTLMSGNVIDFRGRPNTGNMTIPCNWTGTAADPDYDGLQNHQVESLVGNPYPSTMDLKTLFMDPANPAAGHSRNTFLELAVYFWEDAGVTTHYMADYEGGYATYIPGLITDENDDGSYVPATFTGFLLGTDVGEDDGTTTGNSGIYTAGNHFRRYAAIGQGFMLRNNNANSGGTITLDNSMRVYMQQDNSLTGAGGGGGGVFNRTTDEASNLTNEVVAMSHNGLDYQHIVNNPTVIPEIRILTKINDTYYRESLIAFRSNTDASFKAGCDGRIAQKLASDVYFRADDNDLSIKSITYDIDAKVPFGIVAETNSSIFSITVNSLKEVSDNIDVYMYDKSNDSYTDIRNGTFDITLDAGTYNDRFEVVFRNASQEQEELDITEEVITSSFNVYQNNTNNVLTIKNPKAYIVKSFTMYDVTGKIIYNKQNLGNNEEYTFPTSTLSNGMYLTKVVTDRDFEITKKVMVQN
ncbi:MAG: T9SS sorting signal type C domain-containing protein [Flavobacteriaceae bacterium]